MRPGQSQEKLGGAAACAVKRTNLDKRIAWKARDTGADLQEGFEVGKENPVLDREKGLWTVHSSEVLASSTHQIFCGSSELRHDLARSAGVWERSPAQSAQPIHAQHTV